MRRRLTRKLADDLNWYLFRRFCLAMYNSSCVQANRRFAHVLPQVHAYARRQAEEGGFGGDFTAFKLMELAGFLAERQPKTIIEFGGGATTCVLAGYAANNSEVRVISVDESEHFQQLTRDRLPDQLRDMVTFVHAPRVEREWNGARVCHYDHDAMPDLGDGPLTCYVDGPNAQPDDPQVKGKLPCVDAVLLAKAGHTVTDVLFDNRFDSVAYVRRADPFAGHSAKLNYRATRSRDDWSLIDPRTYHSVLSRTIPG